MSHPLETEKEDKNNAELTVMMLKPDFLKQFNDCLACFSVGFNADFYSYLLLGCT